MARLFSFISSGFPGDSFDVVRFQGEEGLSRPYSFVVDLVSRDAQIDLDEVLQNPARLILKQGEEPVTFHGIIVSFQQRHQVNEFTFYQAQLVPRLWWLGQTRHNQIFLQQTLPEIIKQVIHDGGLAPQDFELRLQQDYPRLDYVCQYNESHLNFFHRWLEREGLYYFFEQQGQGEKLIVTDSRLVHVPQATREEISYTNPTGLDANYREEVVHEFCCRQSLVPRSLCLKDYNYEQPDLNLEEQAQVWEEGRGEVYHYGDHFLTQKEGERLARIRAEELNCRQRTFHGQGTVPFLQPGFIFNLRHHYRTEFNRGYLTTELHHQGSQAAFMLAGLGSELAREEREPYYRNSFTALPDDIQFRAPKQSERPHFYGVMHGKVDAAGSGQYAELDDQGRYKIILPFDRSGRKGGTASAWLRMMQPYAGAGHGMHFPLHKGTEVLISFIDGDPDRPVIAGAVPNPDTQSVVTAENASMANITTGSGNAIHMEDKEGSERILLHSPKQNSFIRIGAVNDPDDIDDTDELHDEVGGIPDSVQDKIWEECNPNDASIKMSTDNTLAVKTNNQGTIIDGKRYIAIGGVERKWVYGDNHTEIYGEDLKVHLGNKNDVMVGLQETLNVSAKLEVAIAEVLTLMLAYKQEFSAGGKWSWHTLKERYSPAVIKAHAVENQLKGAINSLVESHNKLTARTTSLAAETSALTGDVHNLAGCVASLGGEVVTLSGELDETALEAFSTLGTKLDTVIDSTEVGVTKTQTLVEKTAILGFEEKI